MVYWIAEKFGGLPKPELVCSPCVSRKQHPYAEGEAPFWEHSRKPPKVLPEKLWCRYRRAIFLELILVYRAY